MSEVKTHKDLKAEYKAVIAKPNSKLYANLISIGICLFFSIPFICMFSQMFIFANATRFITLPLLAIVAIFIFIKPLIYYDLVFNQNPEYSNMDFKLFMKKERYISCAIFAIYVVLLVIL